MDTSQMWLEANISTLTFNTETKNCVYVGNVIDNPPNGIYKDQYEQIKTLWINVGDSLAGHIESEGKEFNLGKPRENPVRSSVEDLNPKPLDYMFSALIILPHCL